jgi:hypothetical protein
MSKAFLSPNGNDLIAEYFGIPSPNDFEAPGFFEGRVSPGSQTQLAAPRKYKGKQGEVELAAEELIDAYAAARGILLKQDAMGWHRPFFNPDIAKKNYNGIEVDIGRPLTAREASDMAAVMATLSGHNEYSPIGTPNGFRLIRWDYVADGANNPDPKKVEKLKQAVKGKTKKEAHEAAKPFHNARFQEMVSTALYSVLQYDNISQKVRSKWFLSQDGYLKNNWQENSDGGNYLRMGRLGRRSDLQRRVRNIVQYIQPRVDAVEREFADRHGWTRRDESVEQRTAGLAESASRSGGRGIESNLPDGITLGERQVGASSFDAVHYGKEDVDVLLADKYGTGIRGAERQRLADPDADPRIKRRVYFYIPDATGAFPRPAPGLGNNRYDLKFDNILDVTSDAAVAVRDAANNIKSDGWPNPSNDFESAVINSGYDGYAVPNMKMMVILNHNVPVRTPDDTLEQRSMMRDGSGIVRDYYMDDWRSKLGIDDRAIEAFGQTGDQQRGEPEILMTRAQRALGGGMLNYAIEHVGDLSNRASPMHNFEWAREAAVGKAKNVLDDLRYPANYIQGINSTLQSNADYHKVKRVEYIENARAALQAYADAHKKLPVFNKVQRLGRDAAIALGELRIHQAKELLEDFVEIAGSKDKYIESLRDYDREAVDRFYVENPSPLDTSTEQRRYQPNTRVGVTPTVRTEVREQGGSRIGGFLQSWWDRNFRAKGNLPQAAFAAKTVADQTKGADNLHIEHLMIDFKKAVKDHYGKAYVDLSAQQKAALNDFLAGEGDHIPETLKDRIRPMREYLDALSHQMITEGVVSGPVIDTILENEGHYLNRSYQVFDDPKWMDKVDPQVWNNAHQYLRSVAEETGYIGKEPLTNNEAENKKLIDGLMGKLLTEGKAVDDIGTLITGKRLGQQDVSMLIRRKEIAPEIRELMGEYKDPVVNFTKTATKLQYAIANHVMLKTIMAEGLGSYLHTAPRPGYSYKLSQFKGVNNGEPLWTSKEIAKAFAEALDPKVFGDVYRHFLMLNGAVKYGKTVLSVTTMARNVLSAFMFSMANGHILTPKFFNEFAQSFGTLRGELKGRRGQREYYEKLKRLGVTLDNPFPSEMIGAMSDAINPDAVHSKGMQGAKKFFGFFTKMYQYGDDLWKIVGFESEKKALMRTGMSEQAAEAESAQRIRDTYPTYSLIGKSIKKLRRTPVIGTFVSFPAEIVRTSVNIARTLKKDMDAGHDELVARRVVGMSIAAGWAAVLTAITKNFMGFDDEDDETVRKLAAPWMRNSNLAYAGYDKDGMPEFFDLSYLDPYNYLKRPINAMLMGGDWKENVLGLREGGGLRDLLDPFLGPDIAAQALLEVIANKRVDGAPVYNDTGSPTKISGEIANHIRKAIQPGTVMNLERMMKAVTDETSRGGTKYTMENEMWALVGFRRTTMNPMQSGRYKAYDMHEDKSKASRLLSYPLGGQNDVTDEEVRNAFNEMMRARTKAYTDMAETVDLLREVGLSPKEIRRVLDSSGLSKQDVAFLIKGKIPRWRPSAQFLKKAREAAIYTAPQSKRDELKKIFRHRQRLVMKLAREYYQ